MNIGDLPPSILTKMNYVVQELKEYTSNAELVRTALRHFLKQYPDPPSTLPKE